MSFPQRRGVSGLHPVLTAPGGGAVSFNVQLAQTTPLEVVSFANGTAGGLLLRSLCTSGGSVSDQSVLIVDGRGHAALAQLIGPNEFTLLGGLFIPATTNGTEGNSVNIASNNSSTIGVSLTYDLITQPYSIN